MSNGPVPNMPVGIWEEIKNRDLHGDGWELSNVYKQLAIVREDTLGKTSWITWAFDPKGTVAYAGMSLDHWNLIRGGELNPDTNTIHKGGTDYRVVYHRNADGHLITLVEVA